MGFTFGIKAIKSGDKAPDGGMGTTLTEHDETLKGTAVLETSEETITWISTEERGKRLAIGQNDSETTLTFEVANPSLATQAYYLGGTVVGDSYTPPLQREVIEKSFLIETKLGYDIEIPNGMVNATPLGGTIGTDNVLTMRVVISAQQPEKDGVGFITYKEKASSGT